MSESAIAASIRCDVLVVGGGAAALVAALEARKSVESVVVACKRKPGRSGNTVVALGGLTGFIPGEGVSDSPEQHLRDTIAGGGGINDPALVQVLVSEAAERLLGLEQYGVRLQRAEGTLIRRMLPGHTAARAFRTEAEDRPGHTRGLSLTLPLFEATRARGVTLLSDTPVHRLLVRDGVVGGALALDARSGAWVEIRAGAVVLAAGGGGQLFANTNNTADVTGDSMALALEAGAALRDAEFVQFYAAVMTSPAHATVSNAVFTDGAVLRNRQGERFMPRYDPTNADNATRDVMSRAIFLEVQAGNGVEGGVYLDLSAVPPAVLERKFAPLAKLLRGCAFDPATRWPVVSPAAHFLMGGTWIDPRCRTGVEGLFAAGEAAGGVHGANRLAGNALTEAAVFGALAGREAAAHARGVKAPPEPRRGQIEPPARRSGDLSLAEVRAELRRAMWTHASIARTEAGLRRASATIKECLESLPRCRVETSLDVAACLELERMALAARALVAAALERAESRGAHYRTDHPARDDARWLGSTQVEKTGEALKVGFVPLTG